MNFDLLENPTVLLVAGTLLLAMLMVGILALSLRSSNAATILSRSSSNGARSSVNQVSKDNLSVPKDIVDQLPCDQQVLKGAIIKSTNGNDYLWLPQEKTDSIQALYVMAYDGDMEKWVHLDSAKPSLQIGNKYAATLSSGREVEFDMTSYMTNKSRLDEETPLSLIRVRPEGVNLELIKLAQVLVQQACKQILKWFQVNGLEGDSYSQDKGDRQTPANDDNAPVRRR